MKPELNEPVTKSKQNKKQNLNKSEPENPSPLSQLKQSNKKGFSLFSTDHSQNTKTLSKL